MRCRRRARNARAIRRDGAAALDLCYVAAGRVDAFWEERLHPWDMMAGSVIVEEAGGRVTRFDIEGDRLSLAASDGSRVLRFVAVEETDDGVASE